MIEIRQATLDDTDALHAISLATGDGGLDAAPLHAIPTLVGDLYSVPYLHLEPSLSFVACDEKGVVGFVVGAAETRDFERRMRAEWLPNCSEKYPSRSDPTLKLEDQRRLTQIREPGANPEDVVREFPAHMHMNLDTRARGQGVGRKLFETFIAELPMPNGLHIGARADNAGGIAFWSAVGFRPLTASDERTVWMGQFLAAK